MSNEVLRQNKRMSLFKFEARWIKDDECGKIVDKEWSSGFTSIFSMEKFQSTINKCSKALSSRAIGVREGFKQVKRL